MAGSPVLFPQQNSILHWKGHQNNGFFKHPHPSRSVVPNSSWPRGLQPARLLCPPLLEFTQIHSHWVGDAVWPSHALFPLSLCLQSPLASGSFPMSWLFASGVSIHQHKIKCNLSSPWQLCLYNYKINSTCLVLDILLMAWRGLDEWWSSYVHNY